MKTGGGGGGSGPGPGLQGPAGTAHDRTGDHCATGHLAGTEGPCRQPPATLSMAGADPEVEEGEAAWP